MKRTWDGASALPAVFAITLLASAGQVAAQMATADRLEAPGWWPTKRSMPREEFIGAAQCVRCHESRAGQQATSMARTASPAAVSPVLRRHARLQFHLGRYAYAIESDERQSVYTVTDGHQSRSEVLGWAIGAGKVGQTFLFERDGGLHEARVSYYDTVGRLDFTPNRELENPRDIREAMARPVDEGEARRCFGCHTTASTTRAGFDPARLMPGVTCEACHGPGRAHVEAIDAGDRQAGRAAILSPSTLPAADSVDFCGACHATFWDVKLANERGLAALRSQPYRLQSSACWQGGDDRLTCVACHDPHKPLVREVAAYDRNCLSCHVASGGSPTISHPGRACPVETAGCSACHMPKYDVPTMHFQFTDHLIRIVRPDATSQAR
jgi:hypothetical protein